MHRTSRAALLPLVVVFVCGLCDAQAQGLPGQSPGKLPGQLPGQQPGQLPGKLPAASAARQPAPAVAGMPADACCDVTAINRATGIVTARSRADGKPLEFRVVDASLLSSIRVGQGVFADMAGKRISLDRKTFCCTFVIVESVAAVAPSHVAPAATQPAPPVAPKVATAQPAPPVAPKVATAQPAPLPSSQPRSQPGSLPGMQRLPGPASPTALAAAPQLTRPGPMGGAPDALGRTGPALTPGSPPGVKTGTAGTAAAVNPAALAQRFQSEPLPQLEAGAFRQVPPMQGRAGAGVQMVASPGVVHLQGIDGIKNATGIPQGAKDFLLLHARTLEAQEEDTYIVNVKDAEEWFKTHKVPDSVTKAAKDDGRKKSKGCSTHHISTGCVKNEVQQSVDDLTKIWRKAWSDTTAEAARDWNRAKDCFADHELSPLSVPVAFSTQNEFPVPLSIPNAHGSISMAVPVNANFTATLKVFYIPCLPFAVRPKSLGASGWLETGGILKGSLTTGGQLGHTFLFPVGGGGATFSMGSIPVGIHGAPVSTLEIALYIEGRLTLDGRATLNGNVSLQSMQKVGYDFECSGHGCDMSVHGMPDMPTTAIESVKLDGRLIVKPEIYSALKLSFGGKMLEARAGAHPYLIGELYGCGGTTAMQNTAGDSSLTPSHALTADVDWGFEMRAEAFAANKRVALKELNPPGFGGSSSGKRTHLMFKDLGQSTGLIPTVTGLTQGAVGQVTAFTIKMPQCYPFRDGADNALQYQVRWTGNASPSASAGHAARPGRNLQPLALAAGSANTGTTIDACTFQSAQATCQGTPTKDTAFQLSWPASGSYVVTVAPMSDKHGRRFDASTARELTVTVP